MLGRGKILYPLPNEAKLGNNNIESNICIQHSLVYHLGEEFKRERNSGTGELWNQKIGKLADWNIRELGN